MQVEEFLDQIQRCQLIEAKLKTYTQLASHVFSVYYLEIDQAKSPYYIHHYVAGL